MSTTRRRRSSAIVAAILMAGTSTVAITISTAAPAGAIAYQDWPTFLQNPSRTAATNDPNLKVASASALKLKWSYATGSSIATSPTIVGTTVYVGSWDGNEYAINTGTGALIWKQSLGQTVDPGCNPATIGVTSSATVSNGVLYVGGGDAYWYALDPATGTVLWKVFTGDNSQTGAHYNWSSPLIVNGTAYIGVASNCDNPLVQGHLMKVDLATHQVVGDYNFVPNGQLGGGIWTTPTYDATTNTIFLTTGTLNDYTQTQSMAIVSLDGTTLAYKSSWQLPFSAAVTDSDWGTTPTLTTDAQGNKLVSAANKNGIVYTFNRNNLAAGPVWQRAIAIGGDCPTCGDGTIASSIFANNTLYASGGHNVVSGHGAGGSISALNPGTGAVIWTRQTEQPIFGSPAYVNGMIGEVEGQTFEVLDASTGALLYSYSLGSTVYGAVSVGRSQFYFGALNAKLYAFGIGAATPPPPPDPNCPAGLTCQDVRKPGVTGSEQTTNGVLTVTAAGVAIHGTSDQFRMLAKPVTGDSQTSVQIVDQSTQNAQPQAGVMVRQSTDPASPFYAIIAYPNDLNEGLPQPDLVIWYRPAFGVNSIELTKWYPANKPVSVMIQRTGNLFNAGISFDGGANYQLIPGTTADLDLPATTLQGLAVNSGNSNNTGTASFSNLSVGAPVTTTMTPQAPAHPCPAPWTCTDVGNPNPPGDTTVSAGSYTLNGTGTGIGGASDSMHYVYQSVSGNQALSAQVVTQPGAPKTAQEGPMMRANASATSPFYGAFLNPGGSATVQWRTSDGVPTRAKLAVPTSTSPAWLQIVRYQDTRYNPPVTFFSTLTSTDGSSWSPVLGSSVPIDMGPGAYLAGMAATAAAPRVAPPVVFNTVSIAAPPAAPPNVCPDTFTCKDIGIDILPGDQTYLGTPPPGTWKFDAGGSDIWSVYDSFRFAYSAFPSDPANSPNGDGTISARVVSQANPGTDWMKSGVMIRAGTDPQAPYYGVFVTPQHGVDVQWRPTQAAQTSNVLGPPSGAPIWVLASRYTDTAHNVVYYSAYSSIDGKSFTYVPGSTVALNLPGALVGGIATDSHNSAGLSLATVDNLVQLPGSQPPPGICPSGWQCADIGGALPPGQDNLANGVWSETGGGGDIWGTADAFHLVSQPLAGDGSVSMHVTAQQATSPWAKAGPMLRSTTDPGSPYYAVFVTPANGLAVQWRGTQGGTSTQRIVPGVVPTYLMATRYTSGGTTYYTAYTSPDGTAWTAVPGSTVALNLPGPLLAGFGITSHNQAAGSAVTLDTLTIGTTAAPPPGICPSAWQCADIGGALPPGQDNLANGVWSETGGGGDIWGTADAFHLVSQPLAGDGSVSMHVTAQQATSPWAKAGPMLRSTTDPGSPYYAVFVTPANGLAVQWRGTQGGTSTQRIVPGVVPTYLMATRYTSGGTTYYTAYTSPDGTAWTAVPGSTVALNLPGPLLAGFGITSHNQAAGSAVTLDTLTIGTTAAPPPGICPSAWQCADIGNPTPAGGQTLAGSTWSVQGGGGDIWGTSDAFHYVWQSLPGDGKITARVTSQTNTSPWAKAGLMLRATTDPAAPYYAIFVTPGSGVAVQFRDAQGNATTQFGATGTAPLYLQITRTGTTYSAATSPDGITWTPIPDGIATLPNLAGPLLSGLAVTSHDTGALAAVTYDTVTTG